MKIDVTRVSSKVNLVCVVAILSIIACCFYVLYLRKQEFLKLETATLKEHAEIFDDYYRDYRREVQVLVNPNLYSELYRYKTPTDFSADFSPTEYSNLFNFAHYIQADPLILGARFINEQGYEMLRAVQKNGQITIFQPDQLQDRSNMFFFQNGIKMLSNQVYVSPLDLNIEHQQIEVPYRLVVRFIAPVIDPLTNMTEGIVVLNVDGNKMVQHFPDDKNKRYYIFDEQGYFVLHPDFEMLYGKDLSHKASYFDTSSKDKLFFYQADTDVYQWINDRKLITWKKLQYDKNDRTRYLIMMSETDLPFWLW